MSGTLYGIVRARYETGAYGGAYLRMSTATLDALRMPHATNTLGSSYGLASLLGIPIVFDQDLLPGVWELVDVGTGAVLGRGTTG